MASEGLEYNEVALLVRGSLNAGRLKLHKNGVIFKASKTGKVDQINKDDIESAHWLRVARGQELKVVLKSGAQFRFDGFKENDYSNLSEFLSQFYDIKIEDVELSVKGWNWGTAKFKGTSLSFEVDEKPAFEIPLKDVSQATTAGNNEVTLEFHQHDDAEISLMEMRFYIPMGADSSDADPVKTFHDHVISKADIIQITGDAIVTIPDVACLTPRGRYTMKVFPTFMQLHGKTYDYKIPYTTILRLFLLPHKDQRFMFFVVSMDPPIKQGQTRYPFLITQFEKHEEFDVKLNMSEEEIKEKYDDKLTQEMSGPVYEIISRLMKAVVGKKITVPGSFKSHSGASGMTCSYRAGSGLLYPLERGFIFVHKPPVHVRFDEIACVNFARVSGGGSSSRSFDFELETKNGPVIVFSNIEREEYSRLFDFVTAKNLRIKNTGKVKVKNASKDDKYDDDLFNSDDDQHDAYLEQVKAEAAERDSESEDEDSDDESFAPGDESDRDVKEEFDSDASSSSSEGSGSDSDSKSKKKKQKEKPEKKRKAEKQKSPKKKAKVELGESSAKKKGKKKKDPNAPKRAMSAYMLWLSEARQGIKDENPGISITEISKVAGEKWKKLTDKTKWEKQAALEKEKYQEKMKQYKKDLSEGGGATSSPSKKKSATSKSAKKEKAEKKSSPRKNTEGQKFKSAEFIESSGRDSSDSDDDGKKKKSKGKSKKKDESEDESMVEDASEEEMSGGSDSD